MERTYNFQQNLELDAYLVLASMKGGIEGYMNACFLRRDQFPDTSKAMARAEWLKGQDDEYLTKVSERAAELERS
jgi:hypothetical protein